MKRTICGIFLLVSVTLISSWGYIGHQAVAMIAARHLTPEASQGVKLLLGDKSLGDIASWADEIRDDKTFPEHFINAPLGLTRAAFEKEVQDQPQDNVYKAILANESVIRDPSASREDKEKALKFIVHFVGDLHQPMHVSRKEDKGGNTIQLQFEEKATNLHSLWDSRMIDKQGLSAAEIVKQFDKASPEQIGTWQSDSLFDWLWESYQISTKLYKESLPGSHLGDDYYKAHIIIVDERIEKAGIRLAGLLNKMFTADVVRGLNPTDIPPVVKGEASSIAYTPVKLDEVGKHIGENVNVTGAVAGYKEFEGLLLINLGAPYPNTPLTLVFRGDARALGESLKTNGRKILVLGKLSDYKGKVQMEITGKEQLLQPME